jgi:hypothetical protein
MLMDFAEEAPDQKSSGNRWIGLDLLNAVVVLNQSLGNEE